MPVTALGRASGAGARGGGSGASERRVAGGGAWRTRRPAGHAGASGAQGPRGGRLQVPRGALEELGREEGEGGERERKLGFGWIQGL